MNGPNWHFQIKEEEVERRIDNFLRFKLDASRSQLYRLLRIGKIRVNQRKVKIDYRLQLGDLIEGSNVLLKNHKDEERLAEPLKKNLLSSLIYEDKNFLVLNKPTGIAVHGGSGISLGVIELLRKFYPQNHLSLVHRLDRSTSGGLIIAKKNSALRRLNELLRAHQIKKYYRVLIKGKLPQSEMKIELPLLKKTTTFKERFVEVNEQGKNSTTIFRVLNEGKHCSLVEAELKTGRTHQIRVHAAYSGFPVVGDRKYGDKTFNQLADQLGYHRLYLHAYRLIWQMSEEQKFDLVIPMPKDFRVF